MHRKKLRLAAALRRLRWIGPILMSLIGLGYVLLNDVVWSWQFAIPQLVRETVVLGLVGPLYHMDHAALGHQSRRA